MIKITLSENNTRFKGIIAINPMMVGQVEDHNSGSHIVYKALGFSGFYVEETKTSIDAIISQTNDEDIALNSLMGDFNVLKSNIICVVPRYEGVVTSQQCYVFYREGKDKPSHSVLLTTSLNETVSLINDTTQSAINSTTKGEPSGSGVIKNVVSISQSNYDAGTKVASTLYIING